MPSSSTEPPARAGRWGNVLAGLAVAALVLVLVEGLASLLQSARAAKHDLRMQEESHVRYDPLLGWSHVPGVHIPELYGPGTAFTTNSQGLRGSEEYAKAIPAGKYRVVALGDSFTMGFGVGDAQSYPAQMQALCPALQAVNMGQGGYAMDQDYLWYRRDGVKLDANVLLFAVIADDFFRMQGDNFIGYGKPVLRARNGTLAVENVPPPDWGSRLVLRRARAFVESLATVRTLRWIVHHGEAPSQEDPFHGTVNEGTFAAAGLALDELARLSASRNQRFVLAYLPTSFLLAKEPTPERRWLASYAERSHVPFIDLVPEFEKLTPAQIAALYRWDYHYTVEGNRFVAAAILRRLAEWVPGFPDCGPAAR